MSKCCSAVQPAIHAKLLIDAMNKLNGEAGLHAGRLETGRKDMPNASRWVPAPPSERCVNIMAVTDPASGTRLFQRFMVRSSVDQPRWRSFIRFSESGRNVTEMGAAGSGEILQRRQPDGPYYSEDCALWALFKLVGLPLAAKRQEDLGSKHTSWASFTTLRTPSRQASCPSPSDPSCSKQPS